MILMPLPVPTPGDALRLLALARCHYLRASYHPHGGTDRTHDTPVTHTVWVMGNEIAVLKFQEELCLQLTSSTLSLPSLP